MTKQELFDDQATMIEQGSRPVPLPVLIKHDSHTLATRREKGERRNGWHTFIREVPIHAETPRVAEQIERRHTPIVERIFAVPSPVRSRLRFGQMHLSEAGINIAGTETKSDEGMETRCIQAIFVCVAGTILVAVIGAFVPYVGSVSLFLIFVAVLIGIILVVTKERRRGETELFLPWMFVYGVQVDPCFRWLTLFYIPPVDTSAPDQVVIVPVHFLTLNKLDAQTVAALAETILFFAPDAICMKVPPYEWTWGRKAVLIFFVAILGAMMIGLLALVFFH